jgi:outer membrane protein TolC
MLKHRNGLSTWGLMLALVGPAALSGQQPADTTQPGLKPYVVGQALPPAEQGQTLLPMSLDDAIQRALKANLNIQTANLNPEIQHYSLLSAQAAFTPTFSTTLGYRNNTSLPTSTIQAGSGVTQNKRQTYTFDGSLSKPMQWWGGQLSADFTNTRDASNSQISTYNPSYNSQLSLSYSQPLLAGLKMDNQRAALQTQRIQTDITDLQVKAQVANITNQVRVAYWALRYAIEQIEIQRRNLEQANELLRQDSLQVRLGRMTTSQMLQAAAQVATAQQALLNAQVQWHTQDLNFKSLLVSGPTDPLLSDIINPTDRPTETQQNVDIQAAIQVALQDRTDIREQRQQRDISQVNLEVSKSNTLPTLNLSAGYSLSGVGGNLCSRSGSGGLQGECVLVATGGYGDALTNIKNFTAPTWNVGLTGSYPIGTNPNKANLERAKLQLQQTDLALKSQELTIITQVTNAGYAVSNAYLQLQAAQRSVEAAELSYQGVVQSFGVGAATNYEVVQAQNTLTTARVSELQAVIGYVDAIAQFELVQHVGSN